MLVLRLRTYFKTHINQSISQSKSEVILEFIIDIYLSECHKKNRKLNDNFKSI